MATTPPKSSPASPADRPGDRLDVRRTSFPRTNCPPIYNASGRSARTKGSTSTCSARCSSTSVEGGCGAWPSAAPTGHGPRHGRHRHRANRSRCRSARRRWDACSTCSAIRSTTPRGTSAARTLADPPRRPAELTEPVDEDRGLRDRHQGHRPARPVRPRRQDGAVRRGGAGQDGHHPGTDRARRDAARRDERLRRRRRADPRGQRPLAGDAGAQIGRPGRSSSRRRPWCSGR